MMKLYAGFSRKQYHSKWNNCFLDNLISTCIFSVKALHSYARVSCKMKIPDGGLLDNMKV